jgi:hypothetical protein
MTKSGGSAVDQCVQLALSRRRTAAKNEAQYRRWKQTESTDRTAAGVPGH